MNIQQHAESNTGHEKRADDVEAEIGPAIEQKLSVSIARSKSAAEKMKNKGKKGRENRGRKERNMNLCIYGILTERERERAGCFLFASFQTRRWR